MGHRILIIEDDQHFAAQLKELFEFHGHEPLLAATGPDGIAMAKAEQPDLILVDVMLPQVHGIRVLEEIRVAEGGADVPAMLMSAVYKNESLFSRDMKRLGVLAFLSKPFSLIDLGRKVNGILAEPEAGRQSTRALRGLTAKPKASDTATGTHYSLSSGTQAPQARPNWQTDTASTPSVPGPGPTAAAGPPEDGKLDPQRYVGLLTHLFHSHASGRLDLHTHRGDETIYFLNGYPVWVETTPGAFLAWLEDEGVVSQSMAQRLARQAGDSWNPADALVRARVVAADDMPPLMEGWVAQEVRAGLMHRGTYAFQHVDDFSGMIPVYEVNPIREIWQAVQKLDISMLERELTAMAGTDREIGRTRTFNRLFGYIGTTPELRALGEHLLRPRSLAEVRARFQQNKADVTRCLWLLVSAGLVALADAVPTSKATGRVRTGGVTRRPERPAGPPAPDTRRYGRETVDAVRRAAQGGRDDTPVARIARDYVTRMELDHYAFLGVPREATTEEVDAAYRELAPSYRLRNLGVDVQGETRRQAKELLSRLVQAFNELSDPIRRKRYDALLDRAARLGRRPAGTVSRPAARVPKKASPKPLRGAHIDPLTGYPSSDSDHRLSLKSGKLGDHVLRGWRDARQAMKAGEFRRAFAMLEELRTTLPSEPGLLADMAWCRLNLGSPTDRRTLDKALEWIQLAEAFEMGHPDVVEVHARIMVGSPDDTGAIRALKRVLRASPELTWAKTELERREAKETKSGDDGGLFGGLFGRGKGGRR